MNNGISDSKNTGTPWMDQELGCSLVDILVRFRKHVNGDLMNKGRFDFKDTDHNSENYAGLSNKQITIAAVMLDPSCRTGSFEDKKKVLVRACFET